MPNRFASHPLLKALIIFFCLISVFALPLPHPMDHFLPAQSDLTEWFEQAELDEEFALLKPGEINIPGPIVLTTWAIRISWQTTGAEPMAPPPRFA